MKKSIIAVLMLAAAAGALGVLIGVFVVRMRPSPSVNKGRPPFYQTPPMNLAASEIGMKQADQGVVIRFARDPSPAPPFVVNDLTGHTVSTADLHGQVTLVNFWATWCPPCREEIPALIALQNKYKGRLRIVGVSVDEDEPPAYVKAFAEKFGINYPVVMGVEIAREYGGVPALPTSFLLDTDGRVVQKHVGLLEPAGIEMEVRALLGLPVSARIETFPDTGQIFLKNAERATVLPDVDLRGLTSAQKTAVLKRLNSETCTCGCKLTIAQCRINDSSCAVSAKIAAQIVQEVKSGLHPAPTPAASAVSTQSSPGSSVN